MGRRNVPSNTWPALGSNVLGPKGLSLGELVSLANGHTGGLAELIQNQPSPYCKMSLP